MARYWMLDGSLLYVYIVGGGMCASLSDPSVQEWKSHELAIICQWALLRHKAGQEGRGEILLENSFMRWRCYQGKIMHTTSKNFSVLYVLRKHQQHINIQWHHLRCYFWLIDHPILEQVATPRSFQLELILDCPVLDVRQLVRNKRRKEYD